MAKPDIFRIEGRRRTFLRLAPPGRFRIEGRRPVWSEGGNELKFENKKKESEKKVEKIAWLEGGVSFLLI